MRQTGSRFLTGFMIGAAIGAGAGLLLAPSPGVETRMRIRDLSANARSRASDLPSGMQQSVQSVATRSRSFLGDLRSRMSQAVEAGKEAAQVKREELHAEVEAVTEPKPSM